MGIGHALRSRGGEATGQQRGPLGGDRQRKDGGILMESSERERATT